MKTLIIVLIILSFLQTTVLSINFVLIILICRTFLKKDKSNFYLAFVFGLILSHLSLIPLGVLSILYLLLIFLAQILSSSRSINSIFFLIPFGIFTILMDHFIVNIFLNTSFALKPGLLISFVMTIPVYFILRIWEERFIVRREIKLKV